MTIDPWSRSIPALSAVAVVCLIGASAPAFPQASTTPATEKWRPKDGVYGLSGKDFAERCKTGDMAVDLVEKSLVGDEWNCKITKLTDTGAAAIRLDSICDDEQSKEIITFRRIDDKSFYMNKTQNGKYPGPEYRMTYCSQATQRDYIESKGK